MVTKRRSTALSVSVRENRDFPGVCKQAYAGQQRSSASCQPLQKAAVVSAGGREAASQPHRKQPRARRELLEQKGQNEPRDALLAVALAGECFPSCCSKGKSRLDKLGVKLRIKNLLF